MNSTRPTLSVLVLLALAASQGCSSGSNTPATSDAAPDATPDATSDATPDATSDAASIDRTVRVTVTPLSRVPTTWRIGGAWVFSAPLGTTADDFRSFSRVLDTVLAPAHRYSLRDDVIAHAAAHIGPYADEVERALPRLERPPMGVFRARDFTSPQGIYSLILMEATPAAPMGLTQDGADQPYLGAQLFPFTVRGSILRDGEVFDPMAQVATLTPPPSGVDSLAPPTHFFNIIANSSEFGRPDIPLSGRYVLPYTVVDRSGAGYRVEIGYAIECDEADRRDAPTRCGAVASP